MSKLTSKDVKKLALAYGADLVNIGNIERWEGAPIQQDPRQIMPEARSVIAVGFRVMRGSLRGVEEGTFFSNYSSMGYGGITHLFMPMTVNTVAKNIENAGYEAIPYGHLSDWRSIDAVGNIRKSSVPVAPGRAQPDVMVNLRIAAYLCGMGEIGFSKIFLTPQFGPRQRVGIIITDLELEPDPIYDGPQLCNRCLACVRDCPGKCYDPKKTIKVTLAGKKVEWMDINCETCNIALRGGVLDNSVSRKDSYDPDISDPNQGSRPGHWSPFYNKPKALFNTGQAVCGGRGCMRACMITMEKRGILTNKFKQPFRRREPWNIDWPKINSTKNETHKDEYEAD